PDALLDDRAEEVAARARELALQVLVVGVAAHALGDELDRALDDEARDGALDRPAVEEPARQVRRREAEADLDPSLEDAEARLQVRVVLEELDQVPDLGVDPALGVLVGAEEEPLD